MLSKVSVFSQHLETFLFRRYSHLSFDVYVLMWTYMYPSPLDYLYKKLS